MWGVISIALAVFAGGPKDSLTRNPEFAERLNSVYRHSVPAMSVNELKAAMKSGVVVLDAREADEFEVSHIRYAKHVGYIWFDMRKVYDIPKTDTIVVYCAIGSRSERIGEKLKKAGYQHVFNLFGGLYEWVNRRNPVYTSEDIQTTQIHGYDKNWARWLENGSPVY